MPTSTSETGSTKLDNFVESYRIDYPFQDGPDFAVISLRDEVIDCKESCEHEGWNELYYTDGLFAEADESNDFHGWQYVCADGQRPQEEDIEAESPFMRTRRCIAMSSARLPWSCG